MWLLLFLASVCDGRVHDKDMRPLAPYVLNSVTLEKIVGKPVVGVPFLDPSFGTVMTRITSAPTSAGLNAVIKPMYSTVQAWNVDESLMLLFNRGTGHELYMGDEPYSFLRNLAIRPTDIEHVIWDGVDPRVFYYPTQKNQGKNQLMRVTLGASPSYASTEEVVADFTGSKCLAGAGSRFGLGADPMTPRFGPRRLVGLICGDKGTTKILYSITERKTIFSGVFTEEGIEALAPVAAPSEALLWWGFGYITDATGKYLRQMVSKKYGEHSDIGADARGDTWNTVAFEPSTPGANDSGLLVSHSLKDGTRKVIIGPATGWGYPASGTHVSTTGPNGWAFVGSVGSAHDGQLVGDNELWMANTDTGEVCRVGHARTWAGTNCGLGGGCPWGYWSETHGVLSRRGDRAIFGSDWQGSTSVDTYVLDLRKTPVQVRFKSLCGVTSFNPLSTFDCSVESAEVVR